MPGFGFLDPSRPEVSHEPSVHRPSRRPMIAAAWRLSRCLPWPLDHANPSMKGHAMNKPETPRSSRISGFHKMSLDERLSHVENFAGLDRSDEGAAREAGQSRSGHGRPHDRECHRHDEHPVGIAVNVKVDGRDVLVPMATEESSVVAAVCNSARQCYDSGGFITSTSGNLMIAQIQLDRVPDPRTPAIRILERQEEIASICNDCDPMLVQARRRLPRPRGPGHPTPRWPDGGHPHDRRYA